MHDDTFIYRAVVGIALFAILGVWDYRKHPENPTRLKEYCFLFGFTALTMLYGVAHDYVTWSISHDYFVLAKGIPSAETVFGFDMVRLAMLSTWNVGLVGAVVLLLSNNPDAQGRKLPYKQLITLCGIPLFMSVFVELCAVIVCTVWAESMRNFIPIDLLVLGVDDAFTRVWGMHLGAYGGAGLGVLIAAVLIVRMKRRLPAEDGVAHKGWRAWVKLG